MPESPPQRALLVYPVMLYPLEGGLPYVAASREDLQAVLATGRYVLAQPQGGTRDGAHA